MDNMGGSDTNMDTGGHGDSMSGGHGDSVDIVNTMAMCTTGHMDMGGSGCDFGGDGDSGGHSSHGPNISKAEIYIEVILLVITIIVGLVVNIVAIIVILTTKTMRTGTFLMLGNLCLNGLLIAAICMPVHAASVLQEEWTLGSTMCGMEGYLIGLCALSSVLTHTEVAMVRYSAVAAPQHVYKRLSSWQATLIWVAGAWILAGALIGMGVGLGIVVGEYSMLYSRCTPINMARLFDVVIAGAVIILTCYAILTSCYIRLFIVIKNKVQALGQANSKQNVRFMKVTKTLLVLSVVFIICWLPFILICGVDPDHDKLPIFLHRISHDIAEILSCINPIFYFLRIDEFKIAVKKLLHLKGGEESSDDEDGSTNNKSVIKKPLTTKAFTEESRA